MTYLVLQMIGALLIAAVFGGVLLWLGQVFWGRLVAPVRAKTLEYELEEARSDIITQDQRIQGLHKELNASAEKLEAVQRAKRQLTATLDSNLRKICGVSFGWPWRSVMHRRTHCGRRRPEARGFRPSSKCCTAFTNACSTTSSVSKVASARLSSK
ncbi:MAG: hypothetical protein JRD94_16015 [Deltaproteobacteria bacterium]|nr:hypothetical protein [Deltaproteobacteria bacterium]